VFHSHLPFIHFQKINALPPESGAPCTQLPTQASASTLDGVETKQKQKKKVIHACIFMLCGVGLFLARSFALFPIQNLPIPFDVFRLFLLCLKSWLWFVFNSKSLFFRFAFIFHPV
jgi:hypothetical protein